MTTKNALQRTSSRFSRGWVVLAFGWAVMGAGSAELGVVDPRGMSAAEQALLASLQGQVNREQAALWVRAPGVQVRILEDLQAEGWQVKTQRSLWDWVGAEAPRLEGYLTCDVTNASLNVATSLAGPRRAVVADISLTERLRSLGLKEVLDVRGLDEATAFRRYRSEFVNGWVVHQPVSKPLHLRDLAVALQAFTFFEGPTEQRVGIIRDLGPQALVMGWGLDEHDFVRDISRGSGVVIPSDWALNLSALRHLPADIPARPRSKEPPPLADGERVVAFVVSDGDNVQWLLNGFVDAPGFWASPLRGNFAVSWELAPTLVSLAPRVLAHLYRTATMQDDFVAGPSGVGYYFPNQSPQRAELAIRTAASLVPAQLEAVSLLDSGGGLDGADEVVTPPEVRGVLYKDYAPYHRFAGQVRWRSGKPIVSYRYLLWEEAGRGGRLRPDWLPEGVAEAVGRQGTEGEDRFALINVHAWSFRDSGGPMGAIRRTMDRLPPGTRVVTVTEFLQLLQASRP